MTETTDAAVGVEVLAPRRADLGDGAEVRRLLPTRAHRTLGSWCFLDHYGPLAPADGGAMAVGPHPHIGIQTVSWLFEGAVHHLDSIGSVQDVRPGELNLMTSGRGIAHAEVMPDGADERAPLHGVQLWLALPEAARRVAPAFEHHADLPTTGGDGWSATVFAGAAWGVRSPATVHLPLVGAEVRVDGSGEAGLPLDATFEHGVFAVDRDVELAVGDGPAVAVAATHLAVIAAGASTVTVRTSAPARLVVIGGTPFPDPIHMWWNFVAGDRAELSAAVADWNAGRRFGEVAGSGLERIPAPETPWRAEPPAAS